MNHTRLLITLNTPPHPQKKKKFPSLSFNTETKFLMLRWNQSTVGLDFPGYQRVNLLDKAKVNLLESETYVVTTAVTDGVMILNMYFFFSKLLVGTGSWL